MDETDVLEYISCHLFNLKMKIVNSGKVCERLKGMQYIITSEFIGRANNCISPTCWYNNDNITLKFSE